MLRKSRTKRDRYRNTMKFFKKKNKNKVVSQKPQAKEEAKTTVVKYVGENKHVTTTTTNQLGRQTSQTTVIKLTPEEMEELGIVPKTTTPSTATPYLDTRHHDDGEEQSMAGYSMAGYSLGGFSDVLPPPSFQDAAKKQNLKNPPPPYQPTNAMVTPLYEARGSA